MRAPRPIFLLLTLAALPSARAASTAVSTGTVPEFSGVFTFAGKTEFSLTDPTTHRSAWVALRDTSAPYFIESFDAKSATITVRLAGTSTRIALRAEARKPIVPAPAEPEAPPNPAEHRTPDGKVWTDPPPDGPRHPDDPGNAD